MSFKYDLCVVGGLGHVGLPLSITFASKGLKVCAYDISKETNKVVSGGKLPFIEHGAEDLLPKVLANGNLTLTLSPEEIAKSRNVIITIGTPTDLHLSPEPAVEQMVDSYMKYFADGQLVILRSTVFPGTTEHLDRLFKRKGKKVDVAFCPERIVQGYAMKELVELPHIVSGTSESAAKRAAELFQMLNNNIVVMKPVEAELSKLFANAWRYISFSIANQFFIITEDAGVDFYKVYEGMTHNYGRLQGMPRPGFASGPCLFKDTVHLSAFSENNFHIGNAAIQVNEGLPSFVIEKIKKKVDLKSSKVGILGMAFKANIDDKRDSLGYKLLKLLKYDAKDVLCSDVYIKEDGFVDTDTMVKECDVIILGVPHREYAGLKFRKNQLVVDVWNLYGKGSQLL